MQVTSPSAHPLHRSPVGELLREWRASRGISQLDLAMQAGVSARHVSFIETGRTQPSRQTLLVLADTLDIPLRERNRLLEAGGYARYFRQTALAAEEMAHMRGVLQLILDRHHPYPAVVLDRYSNCLMGNGASERLVAALVDPSLLTGEVNYLRVTFHPLGARRWIVNWSELSAHLLGRTQRELGLAKGDPIGAALLDELRGYHDPPIAAWPLKGSDAADLLVPIHIKKDTNELRLFCTFMTFGTPQDVTLQELRIETFFPADDLSAQVWKKMVAGVP